MANKKVEVDIEVKGNLEPTIQNLRKLKQQLRETAAGTAEFDKISAQIRDMDDAIKDASATSDDFAGYLENASGPLGILGKGIRNAEKTFSSFNAVLKASVIGLLVSAIGGLVAAFTQSETAMKKLQPLFIGLEKILGGIFRAFEPVLDIFVEMATTALPYITKGIGLFYSAIFGLFSFIKNTAVGVGKILKGIFTLDFDSVSEGFDKLKNVVSDTMDSAKAAFQRYEGGTKELTKTEKENLAERQKNLDDAAKKREELAKKEEERRKAALEALKSDLDAKIALEINKENSSKETLKKLLDERYQAEIQDKKLSDAQKLLLQEEYAKKLDEAIKADDEKKRKAREAELDAQIQLEKDKGDKGLETDKERLQLLLDQRMAIELQEAEQLNKSEAEKEAIRQKYANQLKVEIEKDTKDRRDIAIKGLQEQLRDSQLSAEDQIRITAELQEQLKTIEDPADRFQLQKGYQDNLLSLLDASYANQKAKIEENYDEFKRFDSQYYADQRAALEKNQTDINNALAKGTISKQEYTKRDAELAKARKEINKQEVASNQEKVALIGNALGQLSSLVGQDTIAGKAFAIAKATIDTYQSAVAAYKSLAGIPVIGPALGAIAAAAAVASGIATVKKIVQVQVPNAPAATGGNVTQSTPAGPGERPTIVANATSTGAAPVRGFAEGGMVRGPGTETSDSIPALLSDGEFVVNSRSTALFRPLLSAINATTNLPQFAVGGLVGNKDNTNTNNNNMEQISNAIRDTFGDLPIRTYVTANDISNQQQFDRTIKSRSLI
jgi:chemotaxis protein histidine kinase CheA